MRLWYSRSLPIRSAFISPLCPWLATSAIQTARMRCPAGDDWALSKSDCQMGSYSSLGKALAWQAIIVTSPSQDWYLGLYCLTAKWSTASWFEDVARTYCRMWLHGTVCSTMSNDSDIVFSITASTTSTKLAGSFGQSSDEISCIGGFQAHDLVSNHK
jgi:hypothetical protein